MNSRGSSQWLTGAHEFKDEQVVAHNAATENKQTNMQRSMSDPHLGLTGTLKENLEKGKEVLQEKLSQGRFLCCEDK